MEEAICRSAAQHCSQHQMLVKWAKLILLDNCIWCVDVGEACLHMPTSTQIKVCSGTVEQKHVKPCALLQQDAWSKCDLLALWC